MSAARVAVLLCLPLLLAGCATPPAQRGERAASAAHRQLARSVTMDGLFDRPDDVRWLEIQRTDLFRHIRRASFTAVRLPINFSKARRVSDAPEAPLDPAWLERIDRVVRNADRAGLAVIVVARVDPERDLSDPAVQERLLADWAQVALQLRGCSDRVYLELLDAPDGSLTDRAWSRLAEEIRQTLRATNPDRTLIVGCAHRYDPRHLAYLDLPPDPNLIYAFAYNEPVSFTQQGEPGLRGSDAWVGTTWCGTPSEVRRILDDLNRIERWGLDHQRALFCASFISTARADPASRVQWTFFVARALEERSIGWAYGQFAGNAGVFDETWNMWRQPLLDALLNQ